MASPKPDSPKPDSPKPPKPKSKKGGGDDDGDRARQRRRAHPSAVDGEKFGEGSEALQRDADKNMLYLLQKEDSTKSKNASAPKQFVFDKVLWKDSVQEDAWHAAGTIVTGSMEGYGLRDVLRADGRREDVHPRERLAGERGDHGARVQHDLQRAASEPRSSTGDVSVRQIYLDEISDLLRPDAPVELREDPKEGVAVSASTGAVTSTEAAMDALALAIPTAPPPRPR